MVRGKDILYTDKRILYKERSNNCIQNKDILNKDILNRGIYSYNTWEKDKLGIGQILYLYFLKQSLAQPQI